MTKPRKVHLLKSWPEYWLEVYHGLKHFEYRVDDRGYELGDHLVLRSWDPMTKKYDKNRPRLKVEITSILKGKKMRVPDGMVIMSIQHVDVHDGTLCCAMRRSPFVGVTR